MKDTAMSIPAGAPECATRENRRSRVLADDRGDVPGWVLITLMTAGLVVLIWALAGPALSQLFEQAIARVSGL
jgi:hypothetical protein